MNPTVNSTVNPTVNPKMIPTVNLTVSPKPIRLSWGSGPGNGMLFACLDTHSQQVIRTKHSLTRAPTKTATGEGHRLPGKSQGCLKPRLVILYA